MKFSPHCRGLTLVLRGSVLSQAQAGAATVLIRGKVTVTRPLASWLTQVRGSGATAMRGHSRKHAISSNTVVFVMRFDSSGESSDDDEDEEGDDDTDFARVGSADRYLMGLPQALRLLDDHPEGHMKDTLEALSGADGLTTVGQAPLCGGMSCVPTVTNLNHASVVAGNSRVVRVASFSQAHVGDCFPKSPNMKENKREMVAAVKILAQLLSDGDVRLVNLFIYRLVVDVAKPFAFRVARWHTRSVATVQVVSCAHVCACQC